MKLSLYSHNPGSEGAKNLAAALDIKQIAHKNSKFKGNAKKTVINWGASQLPDEVKKCQIINANSWVSSNKITTFEKIKGKEYCPPFFLNKGEALLDQQKNGKPIVCRKILNGHSGQGIVIADTEKEVVDAPLYVRYIPKKDEYRVHVAFGKVIHLQRKSRNKEIPDDKVNWRVRNHDNGFIFQQENIIVPQSVQDAAVDAVEACELDFGAVDVIFNEKSQKPYVLEINTAPGIEGTTVNKYVAALKGFLDV